jgi:hypothetical protein
MNWQSLYGGPTTAPVFAGAVGLVLVVIVLWTLVWKGMALWKAAREENKVWFVVLLLVNTVGILDILYLYVFSKKSGSSVEAPKM